MFKNSEVIIPDKRDEAFDNFKNVLLEAPLEASYKIKILDALSAYIQTLKP
jgi:hypothetical protein